MKKIGLIGCGALGSRHLQALGLVQSPLQIFCMDPTPESRQIAEQRFAEVDGGQHTLKLCAELSAFPEQLDLVIVATNANVRRRVVEDLLAEHQVQYLVLEKVLFQALEDFDRVGKLLREKKVQCYVNHPFRMYDFYARLKPELSGSGPIYIQAAGNNWGMACSGMHLVDLFAYLTGRDDVQVDVSELEAKEYHSKRPGFEEVQGRLRLSNGAGDAMDMISFAGDHQGTLFYTISTPELRCFYEENVESRVLIHRRATEWQPEEDVFRMAFQSQLSNRFVESLLTFGTTELPDYEFSARLHRRFIEGLLSHFSTLRKEKVKICPIT